MTTKVSMPCGTVKFSNFSRWLGAFNRHTNKDRIKLIKIVLFESIKGNVFAPSACGLIQSLPRTRVGKHCPKPKP